MPLTPSRSDYLYTSPTRQYRYVYHGHWVEEEMYEDSTVNTEGKFNCLPPRSPYIPTNDLSCIRIKTCEDTAFNTSNNRLYNVSKDIPVIRVLI